MLTRVEETSVYVRIPQPYEPENDEISFPGNGVTGLYRLTDGDVIITVGNLPRWQKLCEALGARELLENPRYATVEDREAHVGELRREIQDRLGRLGCEEGIALLESAAIPGANF